MVTLQILVLSFLVRIQVAQLKRLSFEGRFFVVVCVVMVLAYGGLLGKRVAFGYWCVGCICHDASISQCTPPTTASCSSCPLLHFMSLSCSGSLANSGGGVKSMTDADIGYQ